MGSRNVALVLACAVALTAHLALAQTCSTNAPTLDDLQATAGTDGFSLFYQAINATGAITLNKTSTLTILAPQDSVWTSALINLGFSTSAPSGWTAAQKKLVRGIILYHILPGQPGSYLNRTNTASLNKTLASLVDTFICGPGSVTIPYNDTDPIDNISSVTLDFTSNATINVLGLYKSTTANATVYTDPCFPSVSIYILDGVILPCDPTSPCTLSSTLTDVLNGAGMPMAAPAIANIIPPQMVNGTILLPSDAAVNATVAMANVAFKAAGMAAMTAEQLLAMPQMADLFYYHIIPDMNLGSVPADGTYTTLLKGRKQTYCKVAPPATVTIGNNGTTVKDAASSAANITVLINKKACNGIIYSIDAILVPCAAVESALASLLPAGVASPKPSPKASPSPAATPSPATPSPKPAPSGAGMASHPVAWLAAALLALVLLISS